MVLHRLALGTLVPTHTHRGNYSTYLQHKYTINSHSSLYIVAEIMQVYTNSQQMAAHLPAVGCYVLMYHETIPCSHPVSSSTRT